MESSLLYLAVPVMLALVALEWRLTRAYTLADTFANVGCGALQQVMLLLVGGAMGAAWTWLHGLAPLRFHEGPLAFAAALAGIDFLYYWWHRLSHRFELLWAAHAVHHQSESFNLSVALRQGFFSDLTAWPMYALLALAGVPLGAFAAAKAVHMLWQFWIHAHRFPRLRRLEAIFVTPAHHRLHHARNREYLDCNYGAMFVLWDRLFGTARTETVPVVFGTEVPLNSYSPLVAHLFPFARRRAPLPLQGRRAAFVAFGFALAIGASFALLVFAPEGVLGRGAGAAGVIALLGLVGWAATPRHSLQVTGASTAMHASQTSVAQR